MLHFVELSYNLPDQHLLSRLNLLLKSKLTYPFHKLLKGIEIKIPVLSKRVHSLHKIHRI